MLRRWQPPPKPISREIKMTSCAYRGRLRASGKQVGAPKRCKKWRIPPGIIIPIPPVQGGCILPHDCCIIMTQAECAEEGGEWLGPDTECPAFPAGACIIDATCEILTECQCFEAGGEWLGAGEPCPQPACFHSSAKGTFTGYMEPWEPPPEGGEWILEDCTLIEGLDAYYEACVEQYYHPEPTWTCNEYPAHNAAMRLTPGRPPTNWSDYNGEWDLHVFRCANGQVVDTSGFATFRATGPIRDALIIATRELEDDPTLGDGYFQTIPPSVMKIWWEYDCCP